MISAFTPTKMVERTCLLSCTLFVLTLLAPAASAQIRSPEIDSDPTSGFKRGTNTIEGQVFDSSGRPLSRRCTVRLSSVNVGEFSALTDDNGLFTFRRLREGTYYLRVEAQDYLPATETVDFFDNLNRINHVQIQLRLKPSVVNKPGVVNAALASVPKDALELYQNGIQLAGAGKNREAIEKLKAAVSLYPQFIIALNEISVLYMNLGELEPAAEALRAALKIEPKNPTLRLNYGFVLMHQKKFTAAEAELHQATILKDDSGSAHLYRGKVLIELQHYAEAEKELLRVISLGGNEVSVAYRYLGALYIERGDSTQAIAALEQYLRLVPRAIDADEIRELIKQQQSKKP